MPRARHAEMATGVNPYRDGRAAERIADHLAGAAKRADAPALTARARAG